MFYYNEPKVLHFPKYLVVETPGLNNDIYQLEYDTGLYINSEQSLTDITKCIINAHTAETDLDYYCLGFAADRCGENSYRELESILYFLAGFGKILFNHLKELGVYENGILPYSFRNRKLDSICFMRKDVFIEEIKKELYHDGLYSNTKHPCPQYRRRI